MKTNQSFRISIKGDGEILDRAGNPLNGVQKETLVRRANAYESLRVALMEIRDSCQKTGVSFEDQSFSNTNLASKVLQENP
jgi:hypothetical protein